jgi:hypothetical protein
MTRYAIAILMGILGAVAGVATAIAIVAVLSGTVHVSGPPDQQAGFQMLLEFVAKPLLAVVLGLSGAFALPWLVLRR